MMTTYAIGLIVVVAAIVILVSALRRPVRVAARPDDDFVDGVVSEPVPITTPAMMSSDLPVFDELPVEEPDRVPAAEAAVGLTSIPATEPATATDGSALAPDGSAPVTDTLESAIAAADGGHIRWTQGFAPQSGALGDDARLHLINDLGMVRAAWCEPLLEQAIAEESDPALQAAAKAALERCRAVKAG